MDNEDCLFLIKRIMDMCGQNNDLRSKVDMQAREITNLRAVSASLEAKVGLAANSPHTKAMDIANAEIYNLTDEIKDLRKAIDKKIEENGDLKVKLRDLGVSQFDSNKSVGI